MRVCTVTLSGLIVWAIIAGALFASSPTTKPGNERVDLPTTLPHVASCAATASAMTIPVGGSVQLRLDVTNNSSGDLNYATSGWPFDVWNKEVTRDGQEVGHSEAGAFLLRRHAAMSLKTKDLPAGKTLTEYINVSDIYDMSKPGKYHFKLTRTLRYSVGEDTVVTHCGDEITIVVTSSK